MAARACDMSGLVPLFAKLGAGSNVGGPQICPPPSKLHRFSGKRTQPPPPSQFAKTGNNTTNTPPAFHSIARRRPTANGRQVTANR